MTSYINYAPQIVTYFNVTKEHVIDVYQQVSLAEAQLATTIFLWVVVFIIIAFIVGCVFSWCERGNLPEILLVGVIFALITAVIGSMLGLMYYSIAIQTINPEYTSWIQYLSQLRGVS